MSDSKMREEYEEVVRREFASMGKPEPDFRRNSLGDYIHATHAAAWWAWQASRAAVVVELPDSSSKHNTEVIKAVGRHIIAQGLKVKP